MALPSPYPQIVSDGKTQITILILRWGPCLGGCTGHFYCLTHLHTLKLFLHTQSLLKTAHNAFSDWTYTCSVLTEIHDWLIKEWQWGTTFAILPHSTCEVHFPLSVLEDWRTWPCIPCAAGSWLQKKLNKEWHGTGLTILAMLTLAPCSYSSAPY